MTRMRYVLIGLLLPALLAGCATRTLTTSPDPGVDDVAMSVADDTLFGSRVRVWASGAGTFDGELIAVDNANVYVLADGGRHVWGIPQHLVRKLAVIDSPFRRDTHLQTWGVLGTLSAAYTHGWYLVFSLPVWLLATPIAVAIERHDFPEAQRRIGPYYWDQHARFPAGLPSSWTVTQVSRERRRGNELE